MIIVEVAHLYIKLDELTFTSIEEKSYKAMPKNVYAQAKRVKSSSLKMVKVRLGTVYEIHVTIFNLNKNSASDLIKVILKPEINVEFYDTYSKSYKILNCYCQDVENTIKRAFKNDQEILYEPLSLKLVANEAASWVVV